MRILILGTVLLALWTHGTEGQVKFDEFGCPKDKRLAVACVTPEDRERNHRDRLERLEVECKEQRASLDELRSHWKDDIRFIREELDVASSCREFGDPRRIQEEEDRRHCFYILRIIADEQRKADEPADLRRARLEPPEGFAPALAIACKAW